MPVSIVCQGCGNPFSTAPSYAKRGKRFCSWACRMAPRDGIPQSDGSVLVPLTQGKFAIIDVADAPRVLAHKWCAVRHRTNWYAYRRAGSDRVALHRFILGEGCPELVDHIDGNGLNNRRANMRDATKSENASNSRLRQTNTSGFRGVSWHGDSRRWQAAITAGGQRCYLGLHDTPEQAAMAYDAEALNRLGPLARLNFPLTEPRD